MDVGWTWRTSIPQATHQFPRSPHIFCAFCPVLSLLLFWMVLMELIRTCGLRHAVWQMTQTTSEQSGGGSCSQYFCSIPFPCSSWYKSSQYPFHLSVVCAASVKFLLVADSIHCRRGYSFRVIDLTIWKSCLEFPFEFAVSNSSTCLPAVAVYRLWAFSLPQPSVLDIDSYLCLLFLSYSLIAAKVSSDIHFFFFCNLTLPVVFLATSSRTVLVPFQRSSGVSSSCAACYAVNLLVTSAANCTAFSSLSYLRFWDGMLCCLLASLTFSVATSNWWSVSQSAPGYVRHLFIFVQLRCSRFRVSYRHQESSRYTAALDVIYSFNNVKLSVAYAAIGLHRTQYI